MSVSEKILSSDEESPTMAEKDETTKEEPEIGMLFDTPEEAYNFYNMYARRVGFSIRIQRTNMRKCDDRVIQCRLLVCACEGFYKKVKTPSKKRDDRRFGCMALLQINRIKDGKYKVTKFSSEHTHELVSIEHSHYLKSQRKIDFSQGELISTMHSSGLKQSQIFSYLSEEAGGVQNLNFTKSDCNNFIQKKRAKFFKKGDAECLLEYFKQKKDESKHFFYAFRTDEDNAIRGVFFCDAKSRRDYGLFGDAICFDTTFRTNNYDMLCAPIVGINHHGQTSLFGCGLVDGETIDAIKWLFTTFFEAMGGKKPKSIFTDQAAAISSVVDELLPDSHHGLCLWHLCNNAAKNLSSNGYKVFSPQFKACIYDPETVEEFEEMWEKLLEDNDLRCNEWLQKTYELRKKWAQVYSHAHFCAGMTTSQRSESINKFLKDYFSHGRIVLREFVEMYSKAMDTRRETEREAEHLTRHTTPIMFSKWPVENEASSKYTRKSFNNFQEEIKKTIDLSLDLEYDDGCIRTYKVREIEGRRRTRTLTYNRLEETVLCTCRKFEFDGILCSHALKLFRHLEHKSLPPRYYLKRWTSASTNEDVCDLMKEIIPNDVDRMLISRYNELSRISQRIVSSGSKQVDVFNSCKSMLLEVEAKIKASSATLLDATKINSVETRDNSVANQQKESPLLAPKKRRAKGQSSKRIKSALESKARKKSQKIAGGTSKSTNVAGSENNDLFAENDVYVVRMSEQETVVESGFQSWNFSELNRDSSDFLMTQEDS